MELMRTAGTDRHEWFWVQPTGAFLAAGIWLGLYFWLKGSLGFDTRPGSVLLLGLMASAILGHVLRVTAKKWYASE